MKTLPIRIAVLVPLFLGSSVFLTAAKNITDFDSTQPRGFGGPLDQIQPNACVQGPVHNDQWQDLCPIVDGIWSPQWHAYTDPGMEDYFDEWKGMTMGNAARDPAFFATLSVANQDVIDLLNAAASVCADHLDTQAPAGTACADLQSALYNLLVDANGSGYLTPAMVLALIGLDQDIHVAADGSLQPEELIPVTADLCLRCHFTAGWLEGRSEPESNAFPYLKGQFWGSEFIEYPGWPGAPQSVDIQNDSEADMEGIQCGFCHRAYDNYKRDSLSSAGGELAYGSGGYFIDKYDPFENGEVHTVYDFQDESVFCGTCHDVTNPLIRTRTTVDGVVPDMLHPIERTYTEWYWSSYNSSPNRIECWDCHEPMSFPGAQTWLLYPGMDRLWGAVDQVWSGPPYDYTNIPAYRTQAYMEARMRSEELLQTAGTIQIVSATRASGYATVEVKVTNHSGHRLPTGFAEGRQMWIHIAARDSSGNVIYEDGLIDTATGALLRTTDTKVYEQIPLAKGYDDFELNGWNILDNTTGDPSTGDLAYTPDGVVSHFDKEFHFVLMNYVEKDNRIPPMGFNRSAAVADGVFIKPESLYPNGENYDVTTYSFPVPEGPVAVTAELKYQTFNDIYVEFLAEVDRENTEDFGGRARNIPCSDRNSYDGSNEFCGHTTWGAVLETIWTDANRGDPALMGSASATIGDGGGGCTPEPENCTDGIDNDCDGLVDGNDPDCQAPPQQCSDYTDKDSCEDSPLECDWDRRNGICEPD